MAQPAISGGPSTRYSAYQTALTNPSVVRLADALQIDLQDETQASAIVSIADRIRTSRLPISFSAALAKHPYSDAAGEESQFTAAYVTRALIAYSEIANL